MTPSEKLDAILAAGRIPLIADVVNVRRYPYVWAGPPCLTVGNWKIGTPLGILSDGATGVPDRVPESFFGHDRLVLSPYACYKGVRRRLTRRQCGLMYARLGLKYGHSVRTKAIVFAEGLVLAAGIDALVWRKYRHREQAGENLIETHMVPRPMCWDFPGNRTADAVWVGLDRA